MYYDIFSVKQVEESTINQHVCHVSVTSKQSYKTCNLNILYTSIQQLNFIYLTNIPNNFLSTYMVLQQNAYFNFSNVYTKSMFMNKRAFHRNDLKSLVNFLGWTQLKVWGRKALRTIIMWFIETFSLFYLFMLLTNLAYFNWRNHSEHVILKLQQLCSIYMYAKPTTRWRQCRIRVFCNIKHSVYILINKHICLRYA